MNEMERNSNNMYAAQNNGEVTPDLHIDPDYTSFFSSTDDILKSVFEEDIVLAFLMNALNLCVFCRKNRLGHIWMCGSNHIVHKMQNEIVYLH